VPTTTIRPLSWQEGGLLPPLLAPFAPQFPSAEAFTGWTEGLIAWLMTSKVAVMGLWDDQALVGGLLLEGSREHRTVLATLGAVTDADLTRLIEALQARTKAITYDTDTGPTWQSVLAPLGFRPFVRQTFVQDLGLVEFRDLPETALTLTPWKDSDREAIVALLATANVGTLDGLFLTMPEWPSEAACAGVLDALLAGTDGRFLPWASFVARDGAALRGVILAVESEPGRQALLFDLAVHPAARGQNLSRRLVHTMQRALLAHGFSELLFMTMAENTPVQHLFRREEIVRLEESGGGYWIRPD
jgi:ribosomal protein S18 acetylase RimI-like enzyme